MKTKIATVASVVAVLGAGSAAALVNTQILDGASASGSSAAELPSPTLVELPLTWTDDTSTTSTTSTTTSTSVAATTTLAPTTTILTPVPPPPSMLTAFNLGDAGVVTVDVLDGHLVLVSAVPNAGWQVTSAEDDRDDDGDGATEVEVELRSATVAVEFTARLVDGAIVPQVETRSLAPAASPTPTTVASRGDDHDDDDDEYYDDDRDDDHGSDHDDDHDDDDRDD